MSGPRGGWSVSYHRVDAWSAVSRYTGEVTRRLFSLKRGPDAVLYNPVVAPDGVPEYGVRHAKRVVFSGTLTPKKGIVSLMAAWPAVLDACQTRGCTSMVRIR